MTGIYDAPLVEEMLALARQMLPHLKTVGVIYNPSEINSEQTVRDLTQKAGNTIIKTVPIHNSTEVVAAAHSLAGRVEMIYVPSDNIVWPALETLTQIAKRAGIPVFSSDPDSAKRGVTVALGYAQYDLGVAVAKQIQAILEEGKPICEVPVQKPNQIKMYINQGMIDAFKLKLPQNFPYSITTVQEG